jgi:hypothetical protein
MKLQVTAKQDLQPDKNGSYLLEGEKAATFLQVLQRNNNGVMPNLPCKINNPHGYIIVRKIA